jgi:hypothetical protein
MNVLSRVGCATLIAATLIVAGCGENFRQVATPEPVPGGNPSGTETEVVLNQCPSGFSCTDASGTPTGSVITAINVSGDTNAGNKKLQNQVGSVAGPVAGSLNSPIAFDGTRTSVFTANTSSDSVSRLTLAASTAGFAATTTTITLPAGAAPTGISFQFFGIPYTQDYVLNSGATAICPTGGSLGVISQATATLTATVCLGAGAGPVAASIYKDLSKVFVLDFNLSRVYVVNASTLKVTNILVLAGGSGPFKVAQSNSGLFLYVLNANGTISIIDGEAESVVGSVSTSVVTASPPVDVTQDTNFNDTSANTQINHVWILHADGTVSVFDGTTPGALSWITSLATITPAQAAAGAFPTNIALLRDGTWAYVGIGNTDQIVAIDTSKLSLGGVTTNATTPITVGTHRTFSATLTNNINPAPISATVPVETTTPSVTSVAVSRQGNSSQLSKAYATTQTTTKYFCYDENVLPTDCANSNPWVNGTPITTLPAPVPFLVAGCTNLAGQNAMSCPNLYNGTTIVAAADINGGASGLNHPINTVITTLPAPLAVATCDAGNPATGAYDLQKNCPAMVPALALGRN